MTATILMLAPHAAGAMVLAQEETAGRTPFQRFPWLHELLITLIALGMLALLIYFLRPAKGRAGTSDFRIAVDGPEVQFKGRFPPNLQMLVEQFLLEDCRIPGRYEVHGTWEQGRLAVAVIGDQARMQEQRIRNFLKLHVKSPA